MSDTTTTAPEEPKPRAEQAAKVSRMRAKAGGANVRMYRQGLGDAFLLAFDKGAGDVDDPIYVLIDCGVILGTEEPKKALTAVIENILASTGNHIHLLVITHEHWDHVSSFQQVPDLWDQLKVDTVWMAWTENPEDPLGAQLKVDFKNELEALCLAVKEMANPDTPLAGLVSFFGEPDAILGARIDGTDALGAAAFSVNTHVGMKKARSLAKDGNVRYLDPGTTLDLPGAQPDAVRVYVLGPPRDRKLLKNINPSKRAPQTYSELVEAASLDGPALAPNEKSAFTLALRGRGAVSLSPEEEYVAGICLPFEKYQGVDSKSEEAKALYASYYDEGERWRSIDDDWLSVGGELALQMDSYTNNTSLVLAFELKNGEVLLFPADAQVGNWVSWDDIEPPMENRDGQPVTAQSLLAKTTLYKVGHHGSHNATMRTVGLERMTDPDLVALLPVDEYVAHHKKHWDEMPFGPLLARLYVKTGGRVVRADHGLVTAQKPTFLRDTEWQAMQASLAQFQPLVSSGGDDPNLEDKPVRPDLSNNHPLYYEVSIPFR